MSRYGSPQLTVTSSPNTKLGVQQTSHSVSFLHGSINGIHLLSVTKGKGGTNLIISIIEYNYLPDVLPEVFTSTIHLEL